MLFRTLLGLGGRVSLTARATTFFRVFVAFIILSGLSAVPTQVQSGNQDSLGSRDVYIATDRQVGRGIMRARGDECAVITPLHVVDTALEITVQSTGSVTLPAELRGAYPLDVAVLAFPGRSFICPIDWPDAADLSSQLERHDSGTLVLRLPGGGQERLPVQLRDTQDVYVTIAPNEGEPPIQRGMSGGMLRVGQREAGMLMSVDPATGGGRVLRLDYLTGLVSPYFDRPESTTHAAPSTDVAVSVMNKDGFAVGSAIVRAEPNLLSAIVANLEGGSPLRVTGKVVGRNWYRIETRIGRVGFVPMQSVQLL